MRNKLVLPVGVAAIIMTVLITGWLAFSGQGQSQETVSLNVPETIASLPRTELISGPGAINQIAMMHGKDISIEEGYIAKYQAAGAEIILWISISPTKEEGEELFRLMDEKMPESEVFKNRQEVQLSSREVIRVDGMGQEHYYWVSGKYNYWIAVSGIEGPMVVEEMITTLE